MRELDLFRHAIGSVEAVGKLLAVLVRRMVGQHLLARGSLERLETGFALDGLGGNVSLQLALGFFGTAVALAIALLLCLGSVTHGDLWLWSVAGCELDDSSLA